MISSQPLPTSKATLARKPDLAKENQLKGLDKPAFVERLAHYFGEFNAAHPFRDGNGRATHEFFGQLACEAGYELNQRQIDQRKPSGTRRPLGGDLEL